MITRITDVPSYVAGFRATGEVTKADYETVLLPVVEAVTQQHGHIHFLFILETSVGNFTLGAWWEDALLGFQKFSKWKKIAIVSDQEWVDKLTPVLGALLPGQSKGFSLAETDIAKQWVAKE